MAPTSVGVFSGQPLAGAARHDKLVADPADGTAFAKRPRSGDIGLPGADRAGVVARRLFTGTAAESPAGG
jgi:hypothetical protein